MKWLALMPLRGGSKSIKNKNIKLMAGKPLFYWALKSALDSKCFDGVYVSTDSSEIAGQVKLWLPAVQIVDRPVEFATDTASTESVMGHFSQNFDYDVLALIQATTPFTKAEDFINAKEQFLREEADSLLTGVHSTRFFWTPEGKPLNYDPQKRPRRQDFAGCIMENGAFYFTKSEIFKKLNCRLGGKISVYKMSDESLLEIDSPIDWIAVESLLINRQMAPVVKNIKYLVVDVDGTLTDGGMIYSSDGELAKRFDTRDWKGLQLLEEAGIKVCIMTAENSPSVHARLKKVPMSYYYFGVKDKESTLEGLLKEWNVGWHQIGYIGDDLGDLPCLRKCGFSASPADAVWDVRVAVEYVAKNKGGHSAVREICDLILRSRAGRENDSPAR